MYEKLKKMEDVELEEKIKKIELLSDDALYPFLEGWFYEYYTHRSISREDFSMELTILPTVYNRKTQNPFFFLSKKSSTQRWWNVY